MSPVYTGGRWFASANQMRAEPRAPTKISIARRRQPQRHNGTTTRRRQDKNAAARSTCRVRTPCVPRSAAILENSWYARSAYPTRDSCNGAQYPRATECRQRKQRKNRAFSIASCPRLEKALNCQNRSDQPCSKVIAGIYCQQTSSWFSIVSTPSTVFSIS